MRLSSIRIKDFKRFHDLSIIDIPSTAKLVLLTGPNGSGKTSLFEAFNFWISCINQYYDVDTEYHFRTRPIQSHDNWRRAWESIEPKFHGQSESFAISKSFHENPNQTRKAFYIRSAYRHEPDFTANGLSAADDILNNSKRPSRMILSESRVSENYQRIVCESLLTLYDPAKKNTTAGEITEAIIGELRAAMKEVFEDLVLEGPGNPMTGGTFRFTKGTTTGFHYKNLSGGEKAAFDLLLDFIIKKAVFDDTVFCIDEPELHMHTRLQARLLKQLFALVPDHSQLWISTHSIGMARMASDLHKTYPNEVVFLDFHNQSFDHPVTITPTTPNRRYWKNMFATAFDDLATLIVPPSIVFCEGKRLGEKGRRPSFDVEVYQKIFGEKHPDVEFLPLGGTNQVGTDSKIFADILNRLAAGTLVWSVFDRDDRAEHEIQELVRKNVCVLERRDLESYLWDDEILRALCEHRNLPEMVPAITDEKRRLLAENPANGKPSDDVKAITGQLYNFAKKQLNLTSCGNDAEAFAIATLAPLVSPSTTIYEQLKRVVLRPLVNKNEQ